ncbi:hypothetical protein SASPL_109032 [Salvia splendens]|uniref:Triosephosphate isomerase, cytosolic n=1 Tax=Salvia splendens TaxID=180675 RepID=A0A8X8YE66_SALSN|nr:hypothetical protein SASPL_109032 [Salvia splendens]
MNEFILDEVVANCPLNFNMVMIEDNKANDGGDQPMDAAYQSMKNEEDVPNISVEEKSKSATTRQKEKLYVEEEKHQDKCSSEVMLFNSKSYAGDEMLMVAPPPLNATIYLPLKSMNEFILDEVVVNCPLNFNMVMIEDNKANDGGDQPMDAAYQSMKNEEDVPNISVEEKSKSATTRQKEKLYVEEEKLQDKCSSEVMLFNSKSYVGDEMLMVAPPPLNATIYLPLKSMNEFILDEVVVNCPLNFNMVMIEDNKTNDGGDQPMDAAYQSMKNEEDVPNISVEEKSKSATTRQKEKLYVEEEKLQDKCSSEVMLFNSKSYAGDEMLMLMTWIKSNMNGNVVASIQIICGGAVNDGNYTELASQPNLDGFLVVAKFLKSMNEFILDEVVVNCPLNFNMVMIEDNKTNDGGNQPMDAAYQSMKNEEDVPNISVEEKSKSATTRQKEKLYVEEEKLQDKCSSEVMLFNSKSYAGDEMLMLMTWIKSNMNGNVVASIQIICGGAANDGNYTELASQPNLDGFLVVANLKSMNEFILDEVVVNCPLNFNMVMIEDNKANDGGDQPMDAAYQSMKNEEDVPNISVEEKSKSATTRQKEKLYVEEEKLQDKCSSEVMLFNSKSYAGDEMLMLMTWIKSNMNGNVVASIQIICGGAVNDGNYTELASQPNLDGFLVVAKLLYGTKEASYA